MAYPEYYESDVVLRDGSTIRLRPIKPEDKEGLIDLYKNLSKESLYFRFFTIPEPTDEILNYLTNVDYKDHFALVAVTAGHVVAVARYYRDAEQHDKAEVAFIIADALQGRGIGTKLLERLAQIAQDNDINTFEADVLSNNYKMIDLFLNSGFDVKRHVDSGVLQFEFNIEQSKKFEEKAAERSQKAASASLKPFFEPDAVAVVGVSRKREQIGSAIFYNIIENGFKGSVYPVNPKVDSIGEYKAYAKVSDIPGDVDLAIIIVPPKFVEETVEDCIEKGVHAIVIITAGYGETGIEGKKRQEALVEKIRDAGIRMIGPNCMGILNTKANLNATFSPVYPPAGSVALSTQSGALGLAILDYAKQLNIGISSFVSAGNKADVSGNDLIQYWAEDRDTSVILLYLESFGDPKTFSQLARRISKKKPIVAVKSGRSTAGARAASSHTGALASSDNVVEALFRQAGIIRTDSLEELFDVAALLAHQPPPRGRRVGILTNAGGPGIMAADVCEAKGLEIPSLSDQTVKELKAILPPTASVANPVDMIASATPEQYIRSMQLMLADENIDSLIVIYIPPLVTNPEEVAQAIVEGAKETHGKTLIATFMRAQGAPSTLAPIPCYPFPESAANALAKVTFYGEWKDRPVGEVPSFEDIKEEQARAIVDKVIARGGGWLSTIEAQDLFSAVGIPVAKARFAYDFGEAATIAKEIGFPLVLKAAGPKLLHKTERAAVKLNLTDLAEFSDAYDDFKKRLGRDMTGVVVQQMVPKGVEVMIGAIQDKTFGPLILCGSGGILVELLADVAFRLHPLTDIDVIDMLNEVKVGKLLRGYRGAPPADEAALKEVLLRVSALMEICHEIQELDINPIKVWEDGILAVDARVRVEKVHQQQRSRRILY
ncbi:MAG: GNAT family N-acetyltransferase [Blastocatellia bacterium]|nr:GNAT family N-acetyltransferase [Blastocatellia bacterium]